MPWVETINYGLNYPFLWITCYTQAYFFYVDYGGDQVFLVCKEKVYETYQTIWKPLPNGGQGFDYDGSNDDPDFEYDDQYDEVDGSNNIRLNG